MAYEELLKYDAVLDLSQQAAFCRNKKQTNKQTNKIRSVKAKVQRCSMWSQFPDHALLSELFRA